MNVTTDCNAPALQHKIATGTATATAPTNQIATTATAVTSNKAEISVALTDDVVIPGYMQASSFRTATPVTAKWVTTVLSGFTLVTGDSSASLLNPIGGACNVQFQGNASTANSLKLTGTVSMSGDTVAAGVTYTHGGPVPLVSTISDSVVYNKELSGFNATSGSVQNGDMLLIIETMIAVACVFGVCRRVAISCVH